jgi:outer membrane protein TolC
MISRLPALLLAAALLPQIAVAAEAGAVRPDWLPPDEAILQALERTPAVGAARARLSGAQAENRQLSSGPYETTVRGQWDRRTVRADRDYREWNVEISRGVRLPGKGALDRQAGAAGVRSAQDGLEDALHHVSLDLVSLWIDWLAAAERVAVDQAEFETYAAEAKALSRRVELRDASALELEQAKAAEARARLTAAQAMGAERTARAALAALAPTLVPASARPLPEPVAPARALELWPDIIKQRSHEISGARAAADKERALAQRSARDRVPDPVVGVRTFREFGGQESGAGVFLQVPFGGGLRRAAAARAAATASEAEAQHAEVVRQIDLETRSSVIAAQTALDASREARTACDASRAAARRVGRAYELGEQGLSERLLGERQAFEACRIELQARADAHRAILRLALDAHEFWLDDES